MIRLRGAAGVALLVVALVATGAGAFLLGRSSAEGLQAAGDRDGTDDGSAIWTVAEDHVGEELDLTATVSTALVSGPLAQRSGLLTSVGVSGPTQVAAGDELYRVDLAPVVAGEGAVPAFRDLAIDVVGPDVAQLRHLLCAVELLAACAPSQTFDLDTYRAVERWQAARSLPRDGVVHLGEVLWFPHLPATVAPAEGTDVGVILAEDDRPLDLVAPTVTAVVPLLADQVGTVDEGLPVRLGDIAGTTGPVVAEAPDATAGETEPSWVLTLQDVAGTGDLCAAEACRSLVGEAGEAHEAAVPVVVELVHPYDGPVVPVGALQTAADGSVWVELVDGERRTVQVPAEARGLAAVPDLEVGTKVRLPDPAP